MIVVDASVVVEVLLGRTAALAAVADELAGDLDEVLHAPDIVEPETLSALRRLERAQAITRQQADTAVADFDRLRIIAYPAAPFRSRVWSLRHNLSSYDAMYLAVAESLPGAVLMTGDGGLAAHATQILGEARVRHLA